MKIARSMILAAMMAFLASPGFADNETPFDEVSGEGLSVMVLGSGGPIAHQPSGGRASAGYLIFTDGTPRILMDVGGGTYKNLAESGVTIEDLEFVLLSHLHIDHTGDLSSMIKTIYFHNNLAGKARPGDKPVNIYGPAANGVPFPLTTIPQYPSTSEYASGYYAMPDGVERYLNLFASAISGGASKFAYTANDLLLKPAAGPIYTTEQTFLSEADGLVVKYIPVDHGPVPSVAFRIEYKGKTVVFSGDTGSKGFGASVNPGAGAITYGFGAGNMATIAQGADLLIYDTAVMECCNAPSNPVFHVLHTQPSLIAGVASTAGVGTLVLSHLTPVTSPNVDTVKSIIEANGYTGKIKIAKDLKVYNLGDD